LKKMDAIIKYKTDFISSYPEEKSLSNN
jgi:hypothetical protein